MATLTDAEREALIDARVAERFAQLNELLCHPSASMRGLVALLAEHVRDQERRLLRLEATP